METTMTRSHPRPLEGIRVQDLTVALADGTVTLTGTAVVAVG